MCRPSPCPAPLCSLQQPWMGPLSHRISRFACPAEAATLHLGYCTSACWSLLQVLVATSVTFGSINDATRCSLHLFLCSLLVYQHVFKGAVGEALLSLLAVSQKYQASNKDILTAYGKFYNLLMLSGYDDFQDYILDQILLGRDNPFARAVAQGQVQQGAPILQAVAYDLDTLQGLAVGLETLADYVGEVAPTAGSYWVSAASATALRRKSTSKQLPTSGAPAQSAVVIPADGSRSSSPGGGASSSSSSIIGRPATVEELAQWRAALGSHDHWSGAVLLLQQYYSQHGFGVTSRNSALRWSKGGFEEASEGGLASKSIDSNTTASLAAAATALSPPVAAAAGAGMSSIVLSQLQQAYAALEENTKRHCMGLPAQHAVICGPPGSGKSWLLWEGTLLAGKDLGLRVVEIPGSEISNILDIARGCARYPRVRFILVADHVDLPVRGSAATDLMTGLSAAGGSGWPVNTLLYLGASAASAVGRSDPIVDRCGLIVPITAVGDEAGYLSTVGELLAAKQGKSSSEGPDSELEAELYKAAVAWGKQQGFSVRSAAAFVRSC
eukprot:GHUV01017914.1.p1 GENE.GHUV01017914.1~~GHUV01017914.1.p1  ORF type:complete len:556 (+),score=170.71 GHUV01017914.1:1048-2715(+)